MRISAFQLVINTMKIHIANKQVIYSTMITYRMFMVGSGHEYALNYLRFDMQMIIDEISRTNESRIFYGINLGTYGTFKR